MTRLVLVLVLAAVHTQAIYVPEARASRVDPRTDTANLNTKAYKGPREYTGRSFHVPSASAGLDIRKFQQDAPVPVDSQEVDVLQRIKLPKHKSQVFLRRLGDGQWEVGIPQEIYDAKGDGKPIKDEEDSPPPGAAIPDPEEKKKEANQPTGEVEAPKESANALLQESEEPLETVPSGFKPVANLNGDYYHKIFPTEEDAMDFIEQVTGAKQPFPSGAQPAPKKAKKSEDPVGEAIANEAKDAVKAEKAKEAAEAPKDPAGAAAAPKEA